MEFLPPKTSLQELPQDDRDIALGSLMPWPNLEDLPESFSLGEPLWIGDQNESGREDDFCTAYATCGASTYQEDEILYPELTFAASKRISGDPDAWGQNIRDAVKAQQKYGAAAIQDVPEGFIPEDNRRLEHYPVHLVSEAYKNRKKSYARVDKGPYSAFDDARAALWMFKEQKKVVIFGLQFGWSISDYELSGTPQGFGHCMYAFGYEGDWLLAAQSVGTDAGLNGIQKIHRGTIDYYGGRYGMFVMTDVDVETAKKMHKISQYPWWKQIIYRLFT